MTWLPPDPRKDELDAAARLDESVVGRARSAHARGDRFFQLTLVVSETTGEQSAFGSSDNGMVDRDDAAQLGRVEQEGWHLEHVGYVFVETGATTSNRLLSTGQGTVTRGVVQGVYLFRRVDPA